MMNVIDYLVGNTDRHWGNWGVLVDTRTNRPLSLHPLMDFNQSFLAYDTLDGANCQTLFGRRGTQRQAAEEAVRKIGLSQIKESAGIFSGICRSMRICFFRDFTIYRGSRKNNRKNGR